MVVGGGWWWLKQRHGPALRSQRFYPMASSMSSTTVTSHTSPPFLKERRSPCLPYSGTNFQLAAISSRCYKLSQPFAHTISQPVIYRIIRGEATLIWSHHPTPSSVCLHRSTSVSIRPPHLSTAVAVSTLVSQSMVIPPAQDIMAGLSVNISANPTSPFPAIETRDEETES